MKKQNLKHLFTAALLTLVPAAAYGQDKTMTANIPFAFRAVGSDLPAGVYKVSQGPGSAGNMSTMELRNVDTGKTVYIASEAPMSEAKDGRARITFQCVSQQGCSLATAWSGSGSGVKFSTPPLTATQ